MSDLYEKHAIDFTLFPNDFIELSELGCVPFSPELIKSECVFSIINREFFDGNFIVYPKLGISTILLPSFPSEYDRRTLLGVTVSKFLEEIVLSKFKKPMIIVSLASTERFALKTNILTFPMIKILSKNFYTVPIAIFDDDYDNVVCLDFDLEIGFISSKIKLPDRIFGIEPKIAREYLVKELNLSDNNLTHRRRLIEKYFL